MIYHLFRSILKFSVFQFFGRVIVRGHPIENGPVIYAANHPNQAIDPFLLGAIVPVSPYFLAKSTLFKNIFFRSLFRSLHMIPVFRRSDSENMSQNLETFAEAANVLRDGKAIVIFPEGTSSERRLLLQLKTGAARIALQGEDSTNFTLGVKIQPVSITYSSPRVFQSSVTLIFHTPIEISQYKALYQADARTAVKEITNTLELALREITPEVKDEAHQKLVENVAALLGPTSTDDFILISRIATAVEKAGQSAPELVSSVNSRISEFVDGCKQDGIEIKSILSQDRSIGAFIRLCTVAIGTILFFVPYKLVSLAVSALVKDKHNYASAKIGFGVAFFSLWLILAIVIMTKLGAPQVLLPLWALSLTYLGILTNRWMMEARGMLVSLVMPGRFSALHSKYTSLCSELFELERKLSENR